MEKRLDACSVSLKLLNLRLVVPRSIGNGAGPRLYVQVKLIHGHHEIYLEELHHP